MKTLFFSLLILFHAWSGKPIVKHTIPGGVTVLAVNTSESTVDWKAEKATGNHTGTVKIESGTLVMHCGLLSSGTVTLDMGTMTVTDLSSSDKQKLEGNLRSDYFFYTDKFPRAQLDITAVNHNSEKALHFITILGNLTLRGVTKRITFTANVSKSDLNNFAADANLVINRRDFNIATSNLRYDTFIYKDIHLHVILKASRPEPLVSSL
jgi:polyisoprenoid-binding protein YceI